LKDSPQAFVVNVATEDNLELMHRTAAEYPADVSETEVLGIDLLPSRLSDRIYDDRRVDSVQMRPIARMGGPCYAGLGEIYQRPMPPRPPAVPTLDIHQKEAS
jgi:hypothetical protein